MSVGYMTSYFGILCKDDKEAVELLHKLESEDSTLFNYTLADSPDGPEIILNFNDTELCCTTDEEVFEFNSHLQNTYGKRLGGFMVQEWDGGALIRCEIDERDNLKKADISWLLDYTVDQINKLSELAVELFGV